MVVCLLAGWYYSNSRQTFVRMRAYTLGSNCCKLVELLLLSMMMMVSGVFISLAVCAKLYWVIYHLLGLKWTFYSTLAHTDTHTHVMAPSHYLSQFPITSNQHHRRRRPHHHHHESNSYQKPQPQTTTTTTSHWLLISIISFFFPSHFWLIIFHKFWRTKHQQQYLNPAPKPLVLSGKSCGLETKCWWWLAIIHLFFSSNHQILPNDWFI